MTRRDAIEVQAGSCRWLRFCQQVVSVFAVAAILVSRAEPVWIVLALCALGAVQYASTGRRQQGAYTKRLMLRADGSGTLQTADGPVPAWRCAGGWASRWCCVVTLEELFSGRRVRCLVCRSRNTADDYRHLLVSLRMDAAHVPDRVPGWL